ncbi:uncharacterized protein LOC144174460 [Haemaphysalis longicornis]
MTSPYRTKKAMWQRMAEQLSAEFSTEVTALQVQNKWKSLERAYKKTKANNGSSGAARVVCEYEDELSDVLEKEHHINPTVVLRPGTTIEKTSSQPQDSDENSSSCEEPPASPASAAAPGEGRSAAGKKRKSNGSTVAAMLLEFKEAKKERADRFEKKMALLDRLVTAVEKVAAGCSQ